MAASYYGHAKIVSLLLDNGIPVDQVDSSNCVILLLQILIFLLRILIFFSLAWWINQTALFIACTKSQTNVLKNILMFSPDTNIPDLQGFVSSWYFFFFLNFLPQKPPLQKAVFNGDFEIVQLLANDEKTSIDCKNFEGQVILAFLANSWQFNYNAISQFYLDCSMAFILSKWRANYRITFRKRRWPKYKLFRNRIFFKTRNGEA